MRRLVVLAIFAVCCLTAPAAFSAPVCINGVQAANSTCTSGTFTYTFSSQTPNLIFNDQGFSLPGLNSVSQSYDPYLFQYSITSLTPIYGISTSIPWAEFTHSGATLEDRFSLDGMSLALYVSGDALSPSSGAQSQQTTIPIGLLSGSGTVDLTAMVYASSPFCSGDPRCGHGTVSFGPIQESFILTPVPEPTTIALMGAAVPLVYRKLRQRMKRNTS